MQNELNTNYSEKLDLTVVFRQIAENWKLYAKVLPTVLIITIAFVFSLPRTYTCEVKLAPEATQDGGGLSSLMASFGMGDGFKTDDAISPNLYPDLMESQEFIVSLFDIIVETKDGSVRAPYYEYLEKHQKSTWWGKILSSIIPKKEEKPVTINPRMLTKEQNKIAKVVKGNIKYDYDKKTSLISIKVTDQDPVICASLADTVSLRLQAFITDYRTKKARHDLEYSKMIWEEAKEEYDIAAATYTESVDANWDIVNESAKLQQKKLSNIMDMKYQAYNAINTKLQSAKIKVQEETPVFTVLQGSIVPIKPSGPKRMIITIAAFILAFMFTTGYIMVAKKP